MNKKDVSVMLVEDGEFDILGINQTAEASDSNFKILAEAQNDEDALNKLNNSNEIDLIIMDYQLYGSELNGVALTKKILEQFPKVKVLFCSGRENEFIVWDAKKAGARGYVFKHQPGKKIGEVIKSAINLIMKGYFVWPHQQMPKFTPMEKQIMYLLHDGSPNYTDVAFQLLKMEFNNKTDKITREMLETKKRNVERHANNIMQKLEMHSIGELIRWIVNDCVQATGKSKFNSTKEILPFTGILVIDDDRLEVLNLFDLLFDNEKDYRIMAQVENGELALDLLENSKETEKDELARYLLQDGKIQLVIVNSHRRDDTMNDAQLAEEVLKEYPGGQVKILFYGPSTNAVTVEKVKRAGASGYIWDEKYKSITQNIDQKAKKGLEAERNLEAKRDLKKAMKDIMIGKKVFSCNPPLSSD